MPVNFLTQAERNRLSQFPDAIPESDRIQYFTLTPEDQVQIKRQRRSENRLGFALQLCTLRYLGFCPDQLQSVPAEIVEFLAQQLQIPVESLSAYAQRSQTRTEHLQQIQLYLGFQDPTAQDFKQLARWLLERAMEHDSITVLFQLAAERLYREKRVRPGVTTLERMVATARRQAMLKTYRLLKPLLTRQRRSFLNQLLEPDTAIRNTRLNWLRRPATANSPAAILTAIGKFVICGSSRCISGICPNSIPIGSSS